MLQKSEFEKITGAKRRETREGSEKVGFRGKSGDSDPYGCRRPWAKVAGDHRVFAHFSVAVRSPSDRRFLAVFGLFCFCFLLYFSLTFLLIYWLDSTEENPSKGCANQSTKFPIFGKPEDSVADFPPRVETRSNDVGMI